MVRTPGEAPSEPTEVAVSRGRIVERAPEGAPVLDAAGGVLTAGFWNCHVHLTEPTRAGARRKQASRLQAGLDDMFGARGFTGAVDLASNPRDTLPLRRRIESGELRGPRILTAAEAIHPWRGLPFYTRESVPWFLWWALPTPRTARGARRAVRRQLAKGGRRHQVFTGSYVERDRAYLDPIHDALRSFVAAGGRLLFGTDVGYLPDHDTRGELAALAECGLGVTDVLRMLTTNPAEALGLGSGTVAAGEPADLVLLERLESVADLAAVRATIRGGETTWEAGR